MGSSLGRILAELFSSELETKVNEFSMIKPTCMLWLRYVGDVFCIFKQSQNIYYFLS